MVMSHAISEMTVGSAMLRSRVAQKGKISGRNIREEYMD